MALQSGAPAPMFKALSPVNPSFAFSSVGGRYVVLAFLPPPGTERDAALALAARYGHLFNDDNCLLFGVLPDQASFEAARNVPPTRWFADFDGTLRRLYDAEAPDGTVVPRWVAIDPSLRVLGWAELGEGQRVFEHLITMGPPQNHAAVPLHAPVMIVPRILRVSTLSTAD